MTFRTFPTRKAQPDADRPLQFGRREENARARRERRANRKRLAELAALLLGSAVLAAFAVGAI